MDSTLTLTMQLKPVAYRWLGKERGTAAMNLAKLGHDGAYKGLSDFNEPGALKYDHNAAINLDGRSYVEAPGFNQFCCPTSGKGLCEPMFSPSMEKHQIHTAIGSGKLNPINRNGMPPI